MAMRAETLERRQAARRAEIAERLLPSVEALLESGVSYRDISVDEVLAGTDLSRSTFYRHFTDKHDLLIALAEPALADVFEAATKPWELPPEATRAEYTAAMRSNIDVYRPRIGLINALSEVGASEPEVQARFDEGFAIVRDAVADHIRAGQEAGTVRAEILPSESAGWIVWMAERGMTKLIAQAESDQELEDLAEALISIAWHALYSKGI